MVVCIASCRPDERLRLIFTCCHPTAVELDRADLFRRLNAHDAAATADARAVELVGNAAGRAFLERRLSQARE